jgi:integrating conjugative element protein (TIGR03758 family)
VTPTTFERMTDDQIAAFESTSTFTLAESSYFFNGLVFSLLLIWGTWALRTAYTGWADGQLKGRQFGAVAARVALMYLFLGFLLLRH